jgi:hypothetical protein
LADESRIGESEEVPPWGWGSGCIMDMASKLLTKREKKERKEREKIKERQRKEGGGASSFLISAEKEETEAYRGRFRRGKRETSSLDTKISYKW